GFGRAMADAEGGYRFRTIRPVPYPGRTPHIHFKIYRRDSPVLTTQMYVAGASGNARDGLYRSLSPAEQGLVTVDLRSGSGDTDWEGQFDLIVPASPDPPPPPRQVNVPFRHNSGGTELDPFRVMTRSPPELSRRRLL